LRQLLQHLDSGQTELAQVPAPGPRPGHVLIATTVNAVSLGTERMLVEFGRANWFQKARQQPEKFRQVLAKAKAEGWLATWRAVRGRLAQPLPLGYCQVGVVRDGGGDPRFSPGDRVVSNGPHAEVVSVPAGWVAPIPRGVADESAAFAPLAAIALQGSRLLAAAPGEPVLVVGLGLIGQLAVRVLRAQGCVVIGVDPDPEKCAVARETGATTFGSVADAGAAGQVVAGALVTAASESSEPLNASARVCRRHGKVVLIGVTGMQLDRADFYRREVSLQVSNSYGAPDATDPFSAQGNFHQVLAWMATGQLDVARLISWRRPFAEAAELYADLRRPGTYGQVLIHEPTYDEGRTVVLRPATRATGTFALLGAGQFAARTLLPALARTVPRPELSWVVSARGATALLAARQAGAVRASTDTAAAFADPAVAAVLIATRHDRHAAEAQAALRAGKHAWVEKPLALTEADVTDVVAAARQSGRILMVGYNRRFAPLTARVRAAIARQPGHRAFTLTINAGRLPDDHWALAPAVGGGRIVGEVCHFIDLLRHLAGSPVSAARALTRGRDGQDGGRFELRFENGDHANLHYLTDLPVETPKEMLTIAGEGWTVTLDNWRSLRVEGFRGHDWSAWGAEPDKGHAAALAAFVAAVRTDGPSPIPLAELEEVARWSIRLQAAAPELS
jgi:hypothetical protein